MSDKDLEELNEDEIFGENEVTNIDDDVILEDEEIEDNFEDDYDYITSDDIPDYTVKSIIAIIFCLPLGLISLKYAKKTKSALEENDLQSAIDYSDKAGLYFKISIFLTIIIAIVISFTLKNRIFDAISNSDVAIKKEKVVMKKVAPKVIEQWEISAKKLINLEKAFYVNHGFYRYYMSQEIANDEVLGFRYDTKVEKFNYMTEIKGSKLFVVAYEKGKTLEDSKTFRMDLDYNIDKYGFEKKKK